MHLKHLYYGNGKGKTTAALGLAIRAAGCGMKVHIVQFLKGNDTSELSSLALVDGITVARCNRNYGFSSSMTQNDKTEITNCHNNNLREAIWLIEQGKIDLLVLDEVIDAYNLNLIDKMLVSDLVFGEINAELVMTGHKPDQTFIDAFDYVSEIKAIKHPYQNGVLARKGIEY